MGWIALIAHAGMAYGELVPPMIVAGIGISLSFAGGTELGRELGAARGRWQGARASTTRCNRGDVFRIAVSVAEFAAAGGYASPWAFADGFAAAMSAVRLSHLRAAACLRSEAQIHSKETEMQRSTKIAVAGATGRVGRPIVDILESRGYDVVPISRSQGVDVITGEGLDQALTGVETIIDAATGPSPDQQAATEFFTTATRNLQQAGERAGVRRLVVVSIIGIDDFAGGYNAAKVAQEQAALAGPIPARIVRAAQFHEFVEELMRWGTQGDVSYVWKMRTQLVSARTVAEALVELATAPNPEFDAAETTEIAGPREERLVEAARLLAARRSGDLRVEETSDPTDPDSERYANGAALPGPDAKLAGPTFEEWLDATVPAGRA
jgi:uncharacterized protein YbjT (DUF2867 family)